MTTKRQSTTARVTRDVTLMLDDLLTFADLGFIVRHKGQELGVVNINGPMLKLMASDGSFQWVRHTELTIPKHSLPHIVGIYSEVVQAWHI